MPPATDIPPASIPARPIDWVERVAIGASVACLAHCLLLPLFLAALPALAAIVTVPESVHRAILIVAVPAAAMALWSGFGRHRRIGPAIVGAVGLCLLAAAALLMPEGWGEVAVTVLGSTTLAGAHLANWRLRHACCIGSGGA